MKRGLALKKVWSDDELIELKVDVSDGSSFFSTKVYVVHKKLADVLSDLEKFKDQIHGGILDIRFGELANGAFHGRMHFAKQNRKT